MQRKARENVSYVEPGEEEHSPYTPADRLKPHFQQYFLIVYAAAQVFVKLDKAFIKRNYHDGPQKLEAAKAVLLKKSDLLADPWKTVLNKFCTALEDKETFKTTAGKNQRTLFFDKQKECQAKLTDLLRISIIESELFPISLHAPNRRDQKLSTLVCKCEAYIEKCEKKARFGLKKFERELALFIENPNNSEETSDNIGINQVDDQYDTSPDNELDISDETGSSGEQEMDGGLDQTEGYGTETDRSCKTLTDQMDQKEENQKNREINYSSVQSPTRNEDPSTNNEVSQAIHFEKVCLQENVSDVQDTSTYAVSYSPDPEQPCYPDFKQTESAGSSRTAYSPNLLQKSCISQSTEMKKDHENKVEGCRNPISEPLQPRSYSTPATISNNNESADNHRRPTSHHTTTPGLLAPFSILSILTSEKKDSASLPPTKALNEMNCSTEKDAFAFSVTKENDQKSTIKNFKRQNRKEILEHGIVGEPEIYREEAQEEGIELTLNSNYVNQLKRKHTVQENQATTGSLIEEEDHPWKRKDSSPQHTTPPPHLIQSANIPVGLESGGLLDYTGMLNAQPNASLLQMPFPPLPSSDSLQSSPQLDLNSNAMPMNVAGMSQARLTDTSFQANVVTSESVAKCFMEQMKIATLDEANSEQAMRKCIEKFSQSLAANATSNCALSSPGCPDTLPSPSSLLAGANLSTHLAKLSGIKPLTLNFDGAAQSPIGNPPLFEHGLAVTQNNFQQLFASTVADPAAQQAAIISNPIAINNEDGSALFNLSLLQAAFPAIPLDQLVQVSNATTGAHVFPQHVVKAQPPPYSPHPFVPHLAQPQALRQFQPDLIRSHLIGPHARLQIHMAADRDGQNFLSHL